MKNEDFDIALVSIIPFGLGSLILLGLKINPKPFGYKVVAVLFAIGFLILFAQFIVSSDRRAKERSTHAKEERQRLKDAEAAENQRIENSKRDKEALQVELYKQILECRQRAYSFLANGPTLIKMAEQQLSEAIVDYNERAFYPFWDNLERSTQTLLQFQVEMESLKRDAAEYKKMEQALQRKAPNFPVTSELTNHLHVSVETVNRIMAIERAAHKDFEFSSIYAARKTNSILIAGFQNLSDALNSIGNRIEHLTSEMKNGFRAALHAQKVSTEAILGAIDASTSVLVESNVLLRKSIEDTGEAALGHSAQLIRINNDSAERERFAIQALDNIQRNRRPLADLKIFGNVSGMRDPGRL